MKRRRLATGVIISSITALHYLTYLGLWGSAFALGERIPGALSLWLRISVAVLGAPLMLLPESWFLALRPLLGDDTNSLLVVAAFNALLWGIAVFFLFSRLVARRHARSGAAAA